MLNVNYNNNYEIVQTSTHVVIVTEMNHDARIVRLVDHARSSPTVRTWMGDSIGWWEGDTLVIETVGFRAEESLRPMTKLYLSPNAKVIERLRRVDAKQLLYRFTVFDDATFTTPWTAEMVCHKVQNRMLEYACHEGNYSLPSILAGARREKGAQERGQSAGPLKKRDGGAN